MHKFSLRFWCGYLHQPKNITTIPYHFISTLLNVNFDFDVTVANDVAIDVVKCSLPGKLMQWSPCPEVRTLTNENGRYMIKLNDYRFFYLSCIYPTAGVQPECFSSQYSIKEWVSIFLRSWEMILGEARDKSREPRSGSRKICHCLIQVHFPWMQENKTLITYIYNSFQH